MLNKVYIDSDVYTEAKKRIRYLINKFDNIIVCFSGGKDSLALLSLTEEVYKEMGITEKVKVVFRDEEVIPDDVLHFVQEKAESGKYDFRYYAIPLVSNKFCLGKTEKYVQWDRNRRWLRQPPPYAIRLKDDEYREYDQYTADEFITKDEVGSVALLNGVRADESLLRLSGLCQKSTENYISQKNKRIAICKPIYDWSENDIFLYFFKKKIQYCVIYDMQMLNRDVMRVSTPLHSEAAKNFHKLKTIYPTFYQQLCELFPDMLLQSRYSRSIEKSEKSFTDYEKSFNGVRQFIYDTLEDPHQRDLALITVNSAERTRTNNIKRYPDRHNFGGYPLLYVFQTIAGGGYKRKTIMPRKTPSPEDIIFEQQAELEARNKTKKNNDNEI